jgi:hypothetical protein
MINVLYPVNKSVSANLKYFPIFLNLLDEKLQKAGIKTTFMLFSDHLKDNINSMVLISDEVVPESTRSIDDFESSYGISFKEHLYTDLLQTSPFVIKQRDRNWYIPEHEFIEKETYSRKLAAIEDHFHQNDYSFVITDQTTDFEQNFIQYLCEKSNIPFIRYLTNFMNRGFFTSYGTGGNGFIIDVELSKPDIEGSQRFVDDYRSGKSPNIYTMDEDNLKIFHPFPKISLWKKLTSKSFAEYLYLSELRIKDIYIRQIENRIKQYYYDDVNDGDKYIYYGLHLTTESHVALHSFPYVNQISVIESISRALPFGYKLYVKPHPWWEHTIDLFTIKQIKKIPSVRLIHPTNSIKEIISNSSGLVTLNATTGIESLVLGKSVIALSEVNSYAQFHPNAVRCNNLYDLPRLIRTMVDSEVKVEDSVKYISKMFSLSSDIRLEADRFRSDEDADKKSTTFSRSIKILIDKFMGADPS